MTGIVEIILVVIITIHIYFFYLEFFSWHKMIGEFYGDKLPKEFYNQTGIILKNQGLYNAFLAMGLIWSFFITDPVWQQNIIYFFLVFVFIAGVYGGVTIGKKVFFIQALPALVALLIIFI